MGFSQGINSENIENVYQESEASNSKIKWENENRENEKTEKPKVLYVHGNGVHKLKNKRKDGWKGTMNKYEPFPSRWTRDRPCKGREKQQKILFKITRKEKIVFFPEWLIWWITPKKNPCWRLNQKRRKCIKMDADTRLKARFWKFYWLEKGTKWGSNQGQKQISWAMKLLPISFLGEIRHLDLQIIEGHPPLLRFSLVHIDIVFAPAHPCCNMLLLFLCRDGFYAWLRSRIIYKRNVIVIV